MGKAGIAFESFLKKKLEGVFLFVTSKCNSRCRQCFYHESLNDGKDMTFEQIQKISKSAPKFRKLWLSGGEPTLRDDLPEIVKMFYDNNGIKVINFPTNGLLSSRVDYMTGRMLKECPELEIHLNFSLDGLGRTHDRNRGVEGNFKKTIACMELIKRKYGSNKKLIRNVATVITPQGYDEILKLGSYLMKKELTGAQVFEVVRGNPRDKEVKTLSRESIKELRRKLTPLFEAQAEVLFKDYPGFGRKMARFYFLGFMRFISELQDANLDGPHCWDMNCVAGKTTIVLDHNGDFRACEMRPAIGNIADYDYDLSKAYKSEAMRNEIEEIGNGYSANCWCTHGCWILSSIKFSPKSIFYRIPMAYRHLVKEGNIGERLPEVDIEDIENYMEDTKLNEAHP